MNLCCTSSQCVQMEIMSPNSPGEIRPCLTLLQSYNITQKLCGFVGMCRFILLLVFEGETYLVHFKFVLCQGSKVDLDLFLVHYSC